MGPRKEIRFPYSTPGKITAVNVEKGTPIKCDETILQILLRDKVKNIKSPYDGIVSQVMVKTNDTVTYQSGLVRLITSAKTKEDAQKVTLKRTCESTPQNTCHSVVNADLSASICVTHKTSSTSVISDTKGKEVNYVEPVLTNGDGSHSPASVITRMSRTCTYNLIKQKKLALVVDLDNTLVHTTKDHEIGKKNGVINFKLPGSASKDSDYYCKVRPYVTSFLQKLSTLFELYVCTHGHRSYAVRIVKLLDPESAFFSNRILSRDELGETESKAASLTHLFPDGDEHVCIIDDREDVWENTSNLVLVKRYEYLTSEVKIEEDRHDKYLDHLLDILTNLHRIYFEQLESPDEAGEIPCLREIIPRLRRKVLGDSSACVVFSNAFSKNLLPQQQYMYKMAVSLGAEVDADIRDRTTHVCAVYNGTRKVKEARRSDRNIYVVSLSWLQCCSDRWEHVDEDLFPLRQQFPPSKPAAPPHTPVAATDSDGASVADSVDGLPTSHSAPSPKKVKTDQPNATEACPHANVVEESLNSDANDGYRLIPIDVDQKSFQLYRAQYVEKLKVMLAQCRTTALQNEATAGLERKEWEENESDDNDIYDEFLNDPNFPEVKGGVEEEEEEGEVRDSDNDSTPAASNHSVTSETSDVCIVYESENTMHF